MTPLLVLIVAAITLLLTAHAYGQVSAAEVRNGQEYPMCRLLTIMGIALSVGGMFGAVAAMVR